MSINCAETFDWIIYREATLAGLAPLLPVPYVDDLLENRLRRQMISSIAARRGYRLDESVASAVNSHPISLTNRLKSAVLWPLRFPTKWLVRMSRKMFYVLAIRRAAARLSHYWRRAFLLDHMICAGDLDDPDRLEPAAETLRMLLAEEQPDSLTELAVEALRAVPELPSAALGAVRFLRTNDKGQLGASIERFMEDNWPQYAGYFDNLAARYDIQYRQKITVESAPPYERKTNPIESGGKA